MLLLIINIQVKAEYNLMNNRDRPTFIEQGYRNVLNSSFLYVDNEKSNYLSKNTANIPYKIFLISLQPTLNNNNKIKGESYYFTNYEFFVSIKKIGINFHLLFRMSVQLVAVYFLMIII